MRESSWSIAGADGQAILGNAHEPDESPRGVVLIMHGFLGYKDYGMFPRLARTLARAGFVAHRFNFSHSGMTNRIETFERPDLFEADTWLKQVTDVDSVIAAIEDDRLSGRGRPYVLLGHSRGGVTSLLAAGRRFRERRAPFPAGVIVVAAPASTCRLGEMERAELLDKGFREVRSARTGQTLRVDRRWLQEQIDDPAGHDVIAHAAILECPLLVVHGTADPTVHPSNGREIAAAAGSRAELVLVDGANHVFNVPNPLPDDAPSSPPLERLLEASVSFVQRVCR